MYPEKGFTPLERAWAQYCWRNSIAEDTGPWFDGLFSCCVSLTHREGDGRLARHQKGLRHVAAVYGVSYSKLRRYGEKVRRVGR